MDKETVYELEHKAINQMGNSWDCKDDSERVRMLAYTEGIHDMAIMILDYLGE